MGSNCPSQSAQPLGGKPKLMILIPEKKWFSHSRFLLSGPVLLMIQQPSHSQSDRLRHLSKLKSCPSPRFEVFACAKEKPFEIPLSPVEPTNLNVVLPSGWTDSISQSNPSQIQNEKKTTKTVVGGRWSVAGGRWSVTGGPWSVVDGPWAVVDGPWSVIHVRNRHFNS